MPLIKKLNAKILRKIAENYKETHHGKEHSNTYKLAEQLWQQAQSDTLTEKQCAEILRERLEDLNSAFGNSLGDAIRTTLDNFYGRKSRSLTILCIPLIEGEYYPDIERYKLHESYLNQDFGQLFSSFYDHFTDEHPIFEHKNHRTIIRQEILRQIENNGINHNFFRTAERILRSDPNFTELILTNPQTFSQFYAPKIRDMDQRQLVNLYVGIKKGIITPWAHDLSHSLKAVKYTLMAKVKNNDIDTNVKPKEISAVIDDKRHSFSPFSTNARKHIDGLENCEKLKQTLRKSSEPPKLVFQTILQKQQTAIEQMAHPVDCEM
ncbi:hypothetical protein Psal006b_00221 [Piscirickettsia salmonis]|uniref:Uncharacterized protein n=1 Tax=Piscirickettsia salmonis TaxID=1238 RepID=A0A1L6TFB8_PISSA|nr:hypothetical protein [Piscirickettsia salmonis]AKP72411.1 hypothetical protein PSLF89_229 [Piscirickettsia salmonis LF-89 = ATCC VR-1361]ALB24132.1 hypothetical protein KU39_2957 [Piscirickettsia salmonis]ALY03939.1 hypothetical protein AWE47_14580 [Piscirickettsia salmonis]AMA43500.1 hypothetical protein AWJ11_14795 [Piscirickettsia salmonis]AOS35969.1 hypothetical protein AVM72_11910 [Piscirickettsia salmonis]